ncbi:MAG: MBL fold metallo-hydrolase [Herpetosiphonaceae bacterium]|nr:MBL fold metallo-hydrolase [Herpetosiphonaceae bacterium]
MAKKQHVLLAERGGVDLKVGSVFFIGTATTLLRYAGFTILTDPNFLHQGEQAKLGYGLRSTRQTNPAIPIDELPPLDLVLLSHMHGDHWDHVASERLDQRLPIITTRSAAAALRGEGFRETHGLKTWQSYIFRKGDVTLRITAMPGKHGPGVIARLLPPVMGSLLEFEGADGTRLLRIYITGDTLIYNQLKEIPKRYPEIDLALLHLGGTRVMGILVTMDAEQGVKMLQLIDPTIAIPIHFNDYTVFKSPLEDFQSAVKAAGLERQVRYVAAGERYRFEVPRKRRG